MKLEQLECERLLSKWQGILKLQDWDIKILIVDSEWRKSGDIKIDECNRKAILMLNGINPRVDNVEEVIIHELIHVKLWKMDQMIERMINTVYGEDEKDPKRELIYEEFMVALESTTQDVTKGYVQLGAENKNTGFGYVEEKVNEELGR
ncbi:hypothetical protein HYG86_15095 [Alkalicella caledoniensis]|uniref:SprT-like family protein n=1 Tax=Alkalicella caledoniensis TaxID=2731377 RepID=A0A7G9WBD8_ALKCA|nr:hypothetical protein [Alkalicella caledoniensis]QNO16000.1 hypothetical protein HYG86_15095 [Alkalicella caledoniensis]